MRKVTSGIRYQLVIIGFAIGYLMLNCRQVIAQKYTFTHYDIQDGLVQSQVNGLFQDQTHRLWMGTLGGACRFDGQSFYSISKATGLVNNSVYTVFADRQGRTWFGTNKGISCYQNKRVYNYPLPANTTRAWVNHITQAADGTIWLTMGYKLFKITGKSLQHVMVAGDKEHPVTTIATNRTGDLFVSLYNIGIYKLNTKGWQSYLMLPRTMLDNGIIKILFDNGNSRKAYLLADKRLYSAIDTTFSNEFSEVLKEVKAPFLSLEQDVKGDLWLGTTNGAYNLSGQKLTHFTEANGFSDNAVSAIYNDRDNNLWLATQGNGVFKYEDDHFVIFERSADTKGTPIVMTIARGKNKQILLGTDGYGVMKFDGSGISTLWAQPGLPFARKIQCLYTDSKQNVWVGTYRGGIWLYNGERFKLMEGTENSSIIAFNEDANGTIWIATSSGMYYYEHQVLNILPNSATFITAMAVAGKDSILLGTQDGVLLSVNKKIVPGFKIAALNNWGILTMYKYKQFIFLGTDDHGIYIWNTQSNAVANYNTSDGLKANSIYSIIVDKNDIVWTGTGKGVDRLRFDRKKMTCAVLRNDDYRNITLESNQNAILCDDDKVLVGTTKGLTVYNSNLKMPPTYAPYVLINSVKLYPGLKAKNRAVRNMDLNTSLKLNDDQNHIAISFLGVYLKNPESVSYQYRLLGLDDKFCMPVKSTEVDYPSLPPGHYVFEVKALNADGVASQNMARVIFQVEPPFYQTFAFKLSAVLFFILIGIVLQNSWHRRNILQQQAIEAIKREEKIKIRQQTAEDFHDDLGNKLTRITILSDILNAKLDQGKTDQRNLVDQIKQNAGELYNGTKDILWALDPKSDNLYETYIHIKDMAVELLQDTPLSFEFESIDNSLMQVKLPMEYSRNINMIFKELLYNILKHAEASKVMFTITQSANDEIALGISDDGKGFEAETIMKGHGLNNIKARAKRIDAELYITSQKNNGTQVILKFKKNRKQRK